MSEQVVTRRGDTARGDLRAFAHIHLARNPFGMPAPEAWGDLAVIDAARIDRWAERLADERFAVQFIGEQGRGKSTHMRALHARFPDAPFVYLPEGEWRWVPAGTVVFVDELQRMSTLRQWVWSCVCGALAIGTHADHRALLERAGFVVETVILSGLTDAKLAEVIARRLKWAGRRAGEDVPEVTLAGRAWLLERFGDDLRAIEGLLYEVYQRLESVQMIGPEELEAMAFSLRR